MDRKLRSIRYYFCSLSLTVLKKCFFVVKHTLCWALSPGLCRDFSLDVGVTKHGSVLGWSSSGHLACTQLTHSIKTNQFTNPTIFTQQKLLHITALSPNLCPLIKTTCHSRRSSICLKHKAFAGRTLMTSWKFEFWVKLGIRVLTTVICPPGSFPSLLILSVYCKGPIQKAWEAA